jgi:hypothetical protein
MRIYRNADALFLVMEKKAIIYRWKENMIYELEKCLHLSPSLWYDTCIAEANVLWFSMGSAHTRSELEAQLS